MHLFFLLGGLLHATALAVIGFFVLFAASKSTGALKRIGDALGVWLFILAVLALLGGAFFGPMMMGHHGFHGGMMGRDGWGPPPAAAQAPAATPAPSNAAAPKAP
jgi:hypothetical protein